MGSSGPIICSLQRQLNLNLPDLYQCHFIMPNCDSRNEMKCAAFPGGLFLFLFFSSAFFEANESMHHFVFSFLLSFSSTFPHFSLHFYYLCICFRFLLLSIGPISSLSEPYDPIFRHHLKISFLRPSNRARPPCLLFQLSLSLFVKFPNH